MGGMGGGRGTHADEDSVYYVKVGNIQQYRILPIQMTVLVDQDHVQALLVELENSPMSIDVKEFELQRPTVRVIKPEKGTARAEMGGGMMRMGPMMGGRGVTGWAGKMAELRKQFSGGMGRATPRPAANAGRTGTNVRNIDFAEKRKKEEEKIKEAKGPSLFDPYFNIVEVTVYGQARFFKPPPTEPAAGPSPGHTAVVAGTVAAPAAPVGATSTPTRGPTTAASVASTPVVAPREKPAIPSPAEAAASRRAGRTGQARLPRHQTRAPRPKRVAPPPGRRANNSLHSLTRFEEMPACQTQMRSSNNSRNSVCAMAKKPE